LDDGAGIHICKEIMDGWNFIEVRKNQEKVKRGGGDGLNPARREF